MTLRELKLLREDAAALAREEARDLFLRRAGLSPQTTAGERMRAHGLAASADGLAQAQEACRAAEQAAGEDPVKAARAARLGALREFLVRARASGLDPGAAEELLEAERRPSVLPPGDRGLHGAIPAVVARRELPFVKERQRRAELAHALATAASRGSAARSAAWEAGQAALEELRLGDPAQAAARLQERGWAGTDGAPAAGAEGAVRDACERVLAGTDAIARDLFAWLLERHTGARRFPGGAEHHDVLHLIHAPPCASAFPRGEQLRTCRRLAQMLGLDLGAGGCVRLDDDDRPLKPEGARAVAIAAPDEIHVVFLPAEGPRALAQLLAALSVGQLLAGPPGDAPPEDLWMGDGALGHACGHLLGGLVREPLFLRRCAQADLGRDDERAIAVASVLDARLAAASTLASLEAHRFGLSDRAEQAHRELFARAALAELPAGLSPQILDPFLGSWAELRGMAFAARARSVLRERFDEDYFRNPRTLAALRALYARGGRPTLRELWAELSTGPDDVQATPSVEPLIFEIEEACS